MRRIGLSLGLLALAVVGVQSCHRSPDVSVAGSAEDSLAISASNKCADYTDHVPLLKKGLKGDIKKDLRRALTIARQINGVVLQSKSTTTDGKWVHLMPTCKSRKLEREHLDDGRFIGVLLGEGTFPKFSVTPDDIVYWWVYGEKTKTSEGKDTIIHHSQFLSLNDASAKPVMEVPFIVCDMKDAKELKVDKVDWISSHTCPTHDPAMLHGHNPWFGCKLGCCFSTMPS